MFLVEDGVLHVSGTDFGYVATEMEYGGYDPSVEYRWGTQTHSPREGHHEAGQRRFVAA